jgi:hypothetical protein
MQVLYNNADRTSFRSDDTAFLQKVPEARVDRNHQNGQGGTLNDIERHNTVDDQRQQAVNAVIDGLGLGYGHIHTESEEKAYPGKMTK